MDGAELSFIQSGEVEIAVWDCGGRGRPLVLLHGLAGSSRELLPTAQALSDSFHVLLVDQRGHGRSTRVPEDVSRDAFAGDVVGVIEEYSPHGPVVLVGQSMGAHTAFLTAHRRPDLIDQLVMLEGHVAGSANPEVSRELGEFFRSWPRSFKTVEDARKLLGTSPLAEAWIADLEATNIGLRPRFDADVMERTIRAVHEPRWKEWESLRVPTLAIFADNGMFTSKEKEELVRRRPETSRADLANASHDSHLDAFEAWIAVLRDHLIPEA
jgi:pimeloyl-ACP methyl ester carboxylesterase